MLLAIMKAFNMIENLSVVFLEDKSQNTLGTTVGLGYFDFLCIFISGVANYCCDPRNLCFAFE